MSDELLEELLAVMGLGFEDEIGRSVVFARAREAAPAEARTFYLVALEHPGVPWQVKAAIAMELEWWRFDDLAPTLAALGEEVPGLELQIEALTALADRDRCVCDVYAQHPSKVPSPLMDKVRDVGTEHPQVEESEYRCTVCGTVLVHRREHFERGATLHSWRRI